MPVDPDPRIINTVCGTCEGSGRIIRHNAARLRSAPGRMFSRPTAGPCPYCQGTGWIAITTP